MMVGGATAAAIDNKGAGPDDGFPQTNPRVSGALRAVLDRLPVAAVLRECEGNGIVQPQLIVFVGIGVLAAWLIGYAAGWLGVHNDPSALFQAAKGLRYDDIPVAGAVAAFATLVVAAVFHGLVRLWIAAKGWFHNRTECRRPVDGGRSGAQPQHPSR
jgi:hypothetical protein